MSFTGSLVQGSFANGSARRCAFSVAVWNAVSAICRGDWGQWMGPEAFTFFRPLGALIKATFRAARWADGDHEREGKVAAILEKAKEDLKELYKSSSD
jgi:hypothetical protein